MPTRDELAGLREHLNHLARERGEEWTESLSARKKTELAHGDYWRAPELISDGSRETLEKGRGNVKWYASVQASRNYLSQWITEQAKENIFLDYACGIGLQTVAAAKAGAALAIGIDLSPVSLERARKQATAVGVEANTFFLQADCENTQFPDNSVDTILCSGMLHHLNLRYALPEMRRILKPRGKCLAIEALKYNPANRLYRALTPKYRTNWEAEHIIGLKEINFARNFFDVENIRYWHFFSLFTTPFRRRPLFDTLIRVTNTFDSLFLRIFPFSLLAWQITFEMYKPDRPV